MASCSSLAGSDGDGHRGFSGVSDVQNTDTPRHDQGKRGVSVHPCVFSKRTDTTGTLVAHTPALFSLILGNVFPSVDSADVDTSTARNDQIVLTENGNGNGLPTESSSPALLQLTTGSQYHRVILVVFGSGRGSGATSARFLEVLSDPRSELPHVDSRVDLSARGNLLVTHDPGHRQIESFR